jgi:hypothetical protein
MGLERRLRGLDNLGEGVTAHFPQGITAAASFGKATREGGEDFGLRHCVEIVYRFHVLTLSGWDGRARRTAPAGMGLARAHA